MKYIRYRRPGHFTDGVILFDDSLVHADMARGLPSGSVVSAGFVTRNRGDKSIEVFGRSESLNIGRAVDDQWVISIHLRYSR